MLAAVAVSGDRVAPTASQLGAMRSRRMTLMDQEKANHRSVAASVWDELMDGGVFRMIAFIVGLALPWWLRSR